MPFSKKTSPVAVNASERRKQALELRKKGYTYEEIGKEIHCTKLRAWKYVKRELDAIHAKTAETSEEVKTLELQKLDALYKAVFNRAISFDEEEETEKVDLYAVDRCLRIMERKAKLLGLDSPEKLEVDENAKVIFHLPEPDPEDEE